MKRRSLEAEILEQDYFRSLRQSLSPYDPKQANVYLQDAREHLESALSELDGLEVDANTMKEILVQLGEPEEYVREAFGVVVETKNEDQTQKLNSQSSSHKRSLVFLSTVIIALVLFVFIDNSKEPEKESIRILQPIKVSKVSHKDEINPKQMRTFSLFFDHPIDPSRINKDTLNFIPAAQGKISLQDGKQLNYTLNKPLNGASHYKIVLANDLLGKDGRPVQSGSWDLKTPRPKVEWVRQSRVIMNGYTSITAKFNYSVQPDHLKQYLRIKDPEGHPVSYRILSQKSDSTINIELRRQAWMEINCLFKPGLMSANGTLPTIKEQTFKVDISPILKFKTMRTAKVNSDHAIFVSFNHGIETAELKKYINIEPAVDCKFKSKYHGFHILGDFKSGRRYRVTLKKGLPAGTAGNLDKDISRSLWFGDKDKDFGFLLKDGYLSLNHLKGLPIHTTNTDKLQLEMMKLLNHNVVEWAIDYGSDYLSNDHASDTKKINLNINSPKNEITETLIDLQPHLGSQKKGVYYFRLRSKNSYRSVDTLLTLTDLGISIRKAREELLIWVMSLTNNTAISDAKVRVYDRKRTLLYEGKTNELGLLQLKLKQAQATKAELIIVEKGDDLSFLRLKNNRRKRGYENASGRPYLAKSYEVYSFCERGIYRAGDEVHASAFIRNQQWLPPKPFPINIKLYKPSGRILKQKTMLFDQQGRLSTHFKLPYHSVSGKYKVSYSLPKQKNQVLGSSYFLVKDFIPQTLKMSVKINKKSELIPSNISAKAEVKHLFGKAAEGLKTKASIVFKSQSISFPKLHKNYQFGSAKGYEIIHKENLDEQSVNSNGRVLFKFSRPNVKKYPQVNVRLLVEAQEKGGRALIESDSHTFPVHQSYIGLKSFAQTPKMNQASEFHFVAVDHQGKHISKNIPCKIEIFKIDYQYVLRKVRYRQMRYVWESNEKLSQSFLSQIKEGRGQWLWTPKDAGEYRIKISSNNAYAYERKVFVHGKKLRWSMRKGDSLKLSLDRSSYLPNDEAELNILSPFDGRALVTVETNRIVSSNIIELKEGKAKLKLKVKDHWRPNVYVSATLLRPVQPEESWQPFRLNGVTRLLVDSPKNKFNIDIKGPEEALPGKSLPIELQLSSASGNIANASVILCAVDEGILNITRYKSPDPRKFFYAPRRLGISEYDMYNQLSPILKKWTLLSALKPGGAGAQLIDDELSRHLNQVKARRVKPAVVYHGLLKSDEKGKVKVNLDIPEYIGELRLMAVAAEKDRFASISKSLPVRSSIMAKSSWPRFLAPDDEVEVALTLFNQSKQSGNVEVNFDIKGPLQILSKPKEVFLKANEDKTIFVRCKAGNSGIAKVRTRIQLNQHHFSQTIDCPIRPAVKFSRNTKFTSLNGPGKHEVEIQGNYLPGTEKSSLIISGFPGIELSNAANRLIQYPYGCAEQTTSKLVPLIYLHDLLSLIDPGTVNHDEIKDRFDAGVRRLSLMQNNSGGISMWPGSHSSNPYISIYVASVLLEAKNADWNVPDHLLDGLLNYLERNVDEWCKTKLESHSHKLGEAAFALYVLSKADRDAYSWLVYLENKFDQAKQKKISIPNSAIYFLAAGQALSGEDALFKSLLHNSFSSSPKRSIRGFWQSPLRQKAIWLSLLLDFAPENKNIAFLANDLRKAIKSNTLSTQEYAFAIFALGKQIRQQKQEIPKDITITLSNGEKKKINPHQGIRLDDVLSKQRIQIDISGNGSIHTFWASEGIPVNGQAKDEDMGVKVRRKIVDPDTKKEVSLKHLMQGKLYQIQLHVEAPSHLEHLVISDLLAAGLEFEPSQAKSSNMSVDFVENRDDRTLVFCKLNANKAIYEYQVRAVTRGTFSLPAIDIACMYDPGIYSTHGSEVITVKGSE